MPYFDLHCHPGLKTLFQKQDGKQKSPWEDINPSDGILGNILESQSSLSMLCSQDGLSLVCITLHPPEIGMIDQVLIKIAAKLAFPRLLNRDRIEDMISQECTYQMTFEQEQANLFRLPTDHNGNDVQKNIRFLKSGEQYDPSQSKILQVIFNIEGGHTFYDQKNKVKDISAVLENLDKFLAKGFKTLYITPTHLTPNQFITHAYGNKILSKGRLLPKGIGITPYGKALIDHIYSKKILIDIKHMSLVSRRIFYAYRKLNGITTPLIASHVGFNGNYWKFFKNDLQLVKEKSYGYKAMIVPLPGVVANTNFYPLTINLYNEDLREIILSNGLIGISLDVRILGGKTTRHEDEKEFFSKEEFRLLTGPAADSEIQNIASKLNTGTVNNGITTIDATDEEGQELEDIQASRQEIDEMVAVPSLAQQRPNYRYHLRLVLNHILYIYKFCKDEGLPSPWENLCIGSDFDGLVEAVDCCRNVTEMREFATELKSELEEILSSGFEYDIEIEPEELIEKVMFSNASKFIKENCQ